MADNNDNDVTQEGVVARTKSKLAQLGLEFAVPTNPKLERRGLKRLARYEAQYPPIAGDEIVHILDDGERLRIRKLARRMILIAFGIGALSGLASSLASFALAPPEGVNTTFWEDVRDFVIVNGVTILATMVEVAFLYRFALQTVHLIAREAGIRLIPRGDDPDIDERRAVALAIARAALELPNPPRNPFGIDPYKEVSRWRLVIATIFYKLKISLTNLILRTLIRRIAGRAILKAYLTFTDVFATGAWDAWVAWRMTKQAKIRALGPSACESLLDQILREEKELSPEIYETMLRAVATVIVRDRDVHPNLLALMRAIARRSGVAEVDEIDEGARFLEALDALDKRGRGLIHEIMMLSAFPDGRVSRKEQALLRSVLARDGKDLNLPALKKVARRFAYGDPITRAMLKAAIVEAQDGAKVA